MVVVFEEGEKGGSFMVLKERKILFEMHLKKGGKEKKAPGKKKKEGKKGHESEKGKRKTSCFLFWGGRKTNLRGKRKKGGSISRAVGGSLGKKIDLLSETKTGKEWARGVGYEERGEKGGRSRLRGGIGMLPGGGGDPQVFRQEEGKDHDHRKDAPILFSKEFISGRKKTTQTLGGKGKKVPRTKSKEKGEAALLTDLGRGKTSSSTPGEKKHAGTRRRKGKKRIHGPQSPKEKGKMSFQSTKGDPSERKGRKRNALPPHQGEKRQSRSHFKKVEKKRVVS